MSARRIGAIRCGSHRISRVQQTQLQQERNGLFVYVVGTVRIPESTQNESAVLTPRKGIRRTKASRRSTAGQARLVQQADLPGSPGRHIPKRMRRFSRKRLVFPTQQADKQDRAFGAGSRTIQFKARLGSCKKIQRLEGYSGCFRFLIQHSGVVRGHGGCCAIAEQTNPGEQSGHQPGYGFLHGFLRDSVFPSFRIHAILFQRIQCDASLRTGMDSYSSPFYTSKKELAISSELQLGCRQEPVPLQWTGCCKTLVASGIHPPIESGGRQPPTGVYVP